MSTCSLVRRHPADAHPLAATGVLGLAAVVAVVAVHELAEAVVIANGVRAGRRAAFAEHVPLGHGDWTGEPVVRPARLATPAPLPLAVGGGDGCQDDCCKS